jgi:hypothetical protein
LGSIVVAPRQCVADWPSRNEAGDTFDDGAKAVHVGDFNAKISQFYRHVILPFRMR